MATTSKSLYRGAAATSSTTLYTVPSATTTIVTEIIVTNTASVAGTFTITFNGVSVATTVTVAALDSTRLEMKQPLAATQVIAGFASATSINFHIAGVEVA